MWLSRLLRLYLDSSVYSCHLLFISSASIWSLPFLSFMEPILAWNIPLIAPVFLKRSFYCFPLFIYKGLISPCYSLELCIQLGISFPFSLSFHFSFLFSAICKVYSDIHFTYLHFFFFGMVLVTASCAVLCAVIIVPQALCLSDLVLKSICHFHCIIIWDLI